VGIRVSAVASLGLVLAACTMDFDAFDPHAGSADAGSDAAPAVDAATSDAVTGGTDGSTAPDAGVDAGVDAVAPPDGADAAAPCTEPGAVTFMGHCYFALGSNRTSAAATTACTAASAHLVTITSAAESSAIAGVGSGVDRWIGLSRDAAAPAVDASYLWITGEPRAGYANWTAGEPNGSGTCVRMKAGGVQWGDDVCTTAHDAVCERE
jgi:hypothetical protein